MAHDGDTSEVGASRFAAADVRRIGILDIRLFNTDRHAGEHDCIRHQLLKLAQLLMQTLRRCTLHALTAYFGTALPACAVNPAEDHRVAPADVLGGYLGFDRQA